ncbi:hypothetical protein PSCFBP3800_01130 [Pseudomonas syringae group genomosp. 3]|nr:hypothetical protein PSCFBP3800_01130 [Pseudomonas syringae group genomosp. 3]
MNIHAIYLSTFLMISGTAAGAAACIFLGLYRVNKGDPEKARKALATYHYVSRDMNCNPGEIDHILTDHYTGHFRKFIYSLGSCVLCISAATYILW